MTALPPDAMADLYRLVAELEQRLESSFAAHDEAIAQAAATARENAQLRNELGITKDRQNATEDILRIISQSPTDVQPVFDAIVLSAVRLLGCEASFIQRCDGAHFWGVARCGREGLLSAHSPRRTPVDPSANFPSRAIVEKKTLHLPDWSEIELPEFERRIQESLGYNSAVYLPLLREGECIGVLGIAGSRPGIFGENEIALAESFRDQALIAIENTRLFNETEEALARQTATADILRVISQSPTDTQPVFDAVVLTACRLLRREMAFILLCGDGTTFRPVAIAGPEGLVTVLNPTPIPIDPNHNFPSRAIVSKEKQHFPDWSAIDLPEEERNIQKMYGLNSTLYLPMLRGEVCIGVLGLGGRQPGIFGESDIALAESFRDQAVIAIENTRLFNETNEALEQQQASSEVLGVISNSVADTSPVFDRILDSCERLVAFERAAIFVVDAEDQVHLATGRGSTMESAAEALRTMFPQPVERTPMHRAFTEGRVVIFSDVANDPDAPWTLRTAAAKLGSFSVVVAPMLWEGRGIGAIHLSRAAEATFTAKEVALLKTFADQAVIAIQNARLFNETKEALERQTATADILKVIASSPSDAQPVFEAIAERSNRLVGGLSTAVYSYIDETLHLMAFTRHNPEADATLQASHPRSLSAFPKSEGLSDGEVIHVTDVEAEWTDLPAFLEVARLRGFRSLILIPLLRDRALIGMISVTRKEPGRFTDHLVQLMQTFADQAVIAIENVRLFNEVKQRTEDLSESLQQQTATADVLKVISRSAFDLETVMNTLTRSASELCGADISALFLREGDVLIMKGHSDIADELTEFLRETRIRVDDDSYMGRAVLHGEIANIPDFENAPATKVRVFQQTLGFSSILMVPLMREGRGIGVFALARNRIGEYSQRQVELVQTFADQAVIAIENVRLFDEVQARTRDLSEALTYQTGSGNILRVIASSPTDVKPVLKAIVESACQLCEADDALATLTDGEDLLFQAQHGSIPVVWDRQPINRQWASGRAVMDRAPVHVHDLLSSEGEQFPRAREFARTTNVRTVLCVPLLREGESIGVIVLRRTEVRPFSDKQIALLQTFADQAVIAIGNVRLFEEVQARTRDLTESLQQQTATADVLKVISRSAFDLQTVLDTLIESAVRLGGAARGAIAFKDGEVLKLQSHSGFSGEHAAYWLANPIAISMETITGRPVLLGRTVHIPDILAPDPDFKNFEMRAVQRGQIRAFLGIPLSREGTVFGVLGMSRPEPIPFTERQIELVQTFADQAVIAIENARLFEQVQARTGELSKSLDDLRTAQDRLVQTEKLASLGQLTAGIAHEIKNPLNFVNNFAALSAELTDELNDLLKQATITEKLREEVDELTGLLKNNLQKVVQHGQRADSIVKNMLLHSREGSGDHRPADVNALIDESLNLAYHGARAERPDFNVTLQRDFDAGAGMIEVFPQEITRVFLNLVSNGFYAVNKRRIEAGEAGFDPVLSASTRNLGDAVEIRIRDNGTGIPQEVKDKMFNPFFTTKPAGEGTGLGLSMSHDIIVKQHGGTIDVDTEPGQFTEFRIVLPRTSNPPNKNRGQT